MELKLPLVVVQRGRRLVEAWVPGLPDARLVGPSLAEVRDDLALKVMELFEKGPATALGGFQMPVHAALKHVKVETVAHDKARKKRVALSGRLGVLVEKWPGDEFYIATPTRLPAARFALRHPDELEGALARRLASYCLAHGIESLAPFHAEHRERLDVLEVDADPPSIFPRAPRPLRRRARRRRDGGGGAPAETPQQREERRRRRRASVRALREVARNLTHAASDDALERAFGREALVRELADELEAREGTAIVLVGPSGVGKTAVVHEVVRRLAERAAQAGGTGRRDVWRVDGNRFIAGMMYVGQWEARARALLDELVDLGDVLYVDDLASMVYAGRTSKRDTNVAQYLEPHLARGEITVLAECTPERFEHVREEAPTFASLFRVVHVPAMTDRQTLPVLLGVLRELEGDAPEDGAGLRVDPAALEAVLHAARRFLAHEAFPGKAVRLLRAAYAAAEQDAAPASPLAAGAGATGGGAAASTAPPPGSVTVVGRDGVPLGGAVDARRGAAVPRMGVPEVLAAIRRETGLPDFILGHAEPRTPAQVRRDLTAMVAGQPAAIDAVVEVIIAMQHALSDPDKPLATYLFVGPTGVGKTETAKALARYLFGSPQRMLRFDMSEFGSSASISRLVGHAWAPDGELTMALRTQPFCVILLDEIEKAHPRVFDALLQLLGEGRLTDAAGRTADARQAVIIMTSNLGVREAAARTGFLRGEASEARRHYVSAAQKFFRPEFFNRIDRVVPFDSLGPDALRVVVEHALGELLSRRGVRRGNVLVDVEPALLDLLVEQAFDPRYGARPLRRALERKLAVPLAHHLVRRRSEDLALVELYRRRDDMGLAVRALRDAPRLPAAEPDAASWSIAEVLAAFRAVTARAEALAQSDAVARLSDARRAALRALGGGGRDDDSPAGATAEARVAVVAGQGIELLDWLAEAQARLQALDDGDLADEAYVERVVPESEHDLKENEKGLSRDRFRGGLRPRTGFIEVPLRANTEMLVRRARPAVVALRDELEILEHHVRAASGPPERLAVLIECVTAEIDRDALRAVGDAVPRWLAGLAWHAEVAPAPGSAERLWVRETDPRARVMRRRCATLEGTGARVLLEALAGYAVVSTPADDGRGARTSLLRLELLAGGLEAVAARDAAVAAAHEARRTAERDAEPEAPGLVIMRTSPDGARLEHLPTGLAVGACEAVAAAVLRARGISPRAA